MLYLSGQEFSGYFFISCLIKIKGRVFKINYKQMVRDSGLKQTFIASKLSVTPAMLSMFLSGKTNLAPEKRRILDKVLGGDKN
jgi:hypothetical protein